MGIKVSIKKKYMYTTKTWMLVYINDWIADTDSVKSVWRYRFDDE